MTEPIKPKRRVTAQIPISSSPKFPPNPVSSPSYPSSANSRPALRARVDPSSSTSGSSTPTASRPSLRPSQSTASIRASASLPAVPSLYAATSRPRSPVRVKSPYLPSLPSTSASSTPTGGVRARVRAPSPALPSPGLTSPLNQSYAQNVQMPSSAQAVRARVTNVSAMSGGTGGGRPKGFPTESSGTGVGGREDSTAGNGMARVKVPVKAYTQPPSTPIVPNPPSAGSRRSSVVSGSSSNLSKVVSSPIHSPQLGRSNSPVYLQHLQTPGAGPSTNEARRRSISPVRRPTGPNGVPPPIPSATMPPPRPYPLTPTLSPIANIANARLYDHDPTASCPPSPHHPNLPQRGEGGYTRRMPDYPFSTRQAGAPLPLEPELRVVELPPLALTTSNASQDGGSYPGSETSRRASQHGNGGNFGIEGAGVIGLGFESGLDARRGSIDERTGEEMGNGSNGTSAKAAMHGELQEDGSGEPVDGIVEEARINRKVADLEISNASLLAINRSLEISKSKQRAEILRLRRALRESLAGPIHPIHPTGSSSSYFPSSTPRATAFPSSPFSRLYTDQPLLDPDDEEDEFDPGAEGDMEARWAKLEDVLGTMQKRAEVAVRAVAEETRPAGRAVLGAWEGDEDGEGEGTGTGGVGTPERLGEG